MQLNYKSEKAGVFNEDRLVLSQSVVGVIDGATGLELSNDGKRTSASLLASFLKKNLEKYNGNGIKRYLYSLSKLSFFSNYNDATCGLSLVIDGGEFIELVALGDCDIFYRLRTGEIKRFRQQKLQRLDNIALKQMMSLAKKNGISVKSARLLINDTLVKHRKMVNTKDGYYAFQPQKKPNFIPRIVKLEKSKIDEIIVCSDGFSQCFTTLNIIDGYKNLFDKKVDLNKICNEIINVSNLDDEYNKYPRFKLVDDITYVDIKF